MLIVQIITEYDRLEVKNPSKCIEEPRFKVVLEKSIQEESASNTRS